MTTVDSQHKNLFRMAADLHRAMLAGTAKPKLFQLLEDLVQYTLVHFAYEERLMEDAGYPESTMIFGIRVRVMVLNFSTG
jgi:hemerythrin